MHEKYIQCSSCKKKFPLNEIIFRCMDCGGSLEIIFDYKKVKKSINKNRMKPRPFCHSRYFEFFPGKSLISLHEGGTAIIRSCNIERVKGVDFKLFFKNESLNPTGSFKDRGSSVEVAKALEFGAKKVVCASTGNMGASVSAYSGLVGIKSHILAPSDTKTVKKEQILAYGARFFNVKGDYSIAAKMAEEAFRKFGVYLLGDYLYRREGTKSVGFEILEQLKEPDYIACPVGNGTLISAIWKAINEFKQMGFIIKKPKLIGVQASGCSPIVKAVKTNKIKSIKKSKTIAVAIECGNPLDGDRALRAIKESKGLMASVSDKEILKVREILSRSEAMFVEPAGAVATAGILKLKDEIKSRSNVVSLLTGHGLKTPFTSIKGKAEIFKKENMKKIFSD